MLQKNILGSFLRSTKIVGPHKKLPLSGFSTHTINKCQKIDSKININTNNNSANPSRNNKRKKSASPQLALKFLKMANGEGEEIASTDPIIKENGHANGVEASVEDPSQTIYINGVSGILKKETNNSSDKKWSDFDKDTIRLIGLFLSERGLHNVHSVLADSAGFPLELPEAQQLRTSIFNGDYTSALQSLDSMFKTLQKQQKQNKISNESSETSLITKNDIKRIKYHVGVQQYLEFLEKNDKAGALKCLRSELIGINKINPEKVKELSKCLMFRGIQQIRENSKLSEVSNWPGRWLGRFIFVFFLRTNHKKQTVKKMENKINL